MAESTDALLTFLEPNGQTSTIRCHPALVGQMRLHYEAKGWKLVEPPAPASSAPPAPPPRSRRSKGADE